LDLESFDLHLLGLAGLALELLVAGENSFKSRSLLKSKDYWLLGEMD
jgi:hypothetical protein